MQTQSRTRICRDSISCALVLGLLLCVLAGSTLAGAQTGVVDTVRRNHLTLTDCARLALAQSPLLKSVAQDQIASKEAVGEVRGAYYPTFGVRGGASRWQNYAFLPNGLSNPDISSVIGPTDDWSAGGFSRYLLYDSGVRRANLEGAKALELTIAQQGESTRQNVIFDVHQAFYQLAVATELRTVAQTSLSNDEAHLGVAKNRQAAGDTTAADVLRAQVEVDNAKAELIRTESLIRIAKGDLNTVMGLSAEMPVEIDVRGADQEVVFAPNIPTLLEQAIQTRPEIKAARSAVDNARKQVQAAKGDFGPKIYADGSYGWRDNSPALAEEVWFAGITVELTAFEGFSSRHKLNRTRAELSKAEEGLEQVSLAVRKDVWSACARIQEAKELIQATLTQVRDAEESLRLMAARYKAGSATFTDLLDAQTAFTAASARQVQARWSYQQAQSALQRATGTLTVEK